MERFPKGYSTVFPSGTLADFEIFYSNRISNCLPVGNRLKRTLEMFTRQQLFAMLRATPFSIGWSLLPLTCLFHLQSVLCGLCPVDNHNLRWPNHTFSDWTSCRTYSIGFLCSTMFTLISHFIRMQLSLMELSAMVVLEPSFRPRRNRVEQVELQKSKEHRGQSEIQSWRQRRPANRVANKNKDFKWRFPAKFYRRNFFPSEVSPKGCIWRRLLNNLWT